MRDLIPEKIQDENQEGEGKVKEEYRSQKAEDSYWLMGRGKRSVVGWAEDGDARAIEYMGVNHSG